MAFSQGPTDKKYISAFGIDKREWIYTALELENEEFLTDIMEVMGRYAMTPSTQPEYSHFVDDATITLLDTTGATVTGSGTATVVTTLTAATSGYARKTDLVMFPNGKAGYVTNVVTASSQDTLTIVSVNGTNLTHTAGQLLSPFSMAVGEASVKVANRKFGQTQYTNKIQIFREINTETDVQMGSQVELEYNGSHYVIDREMAIKALAFKRGINAAFIGGRMSTTNFRDASPSLVDPLAGTAVQTTRGLDEYVTSYGIVDTVATPGTWNFADLDDVIFQMLAAKTGNNFLVIRPTKAAIKMDAYLKGINSGISSGKLSLDAKTFDYMVESFSYGNKKFQFSTMGIMDNQTLFSQTDIVKSIYFIPLDGVKTRDGGTLPRMRVRYQDHGVQGSLGDKYVAQWDTGALARPHATNDQSVRETHWKSHQGLEILGAKHFAKSTIL